MISIPPVFPLSRGRRSREVQSKSRVTKRGPGSDYTEYVHGMRYGAWKVINHEKQGNRDY